MIAVLVRSRGKLKAQATEMVPGSCVRNVFVQNIQQSNVALTFGTPGKHAKCQKDNYFDVL